MTLRGLQCFTNGRNTGHKGCPFFPKNGKGYILVPYDFAVAVAATDSDATVAANIKTALLAAFVNDAYASRAQFVGKFIGFEDKSEDATFQSFNYKTKSKIGRKKYMLEYQYTNGGQDYHNTVLSFQDKHENYKALIVEDGGILRGANKYTAGVLTHFQGIELDGIDVPDMKEATADTAPEFKVAFTIANAADMNEDHFAVAMGENLFDMIEDVLVTDLVMIPFTATAARVHPFMIKTVAGDVNVADTLGSILNSTTLVTASNENSGTAIAVTSVAVNTLTGKYVITFTAGAGYVATEYAIVRFANVTALHALGADYYSCEKTVRILMSA